MSSEIGTDHEEQEHGKRTGIGGMPRVNHEAGLGYHNEIVLGKRAVTADTALRLARFFGTSDRFWLNLQAAYDLDIERDRLAGRLAKEVRVLRSAS